MKTLDEIALHYGTDKASSAHGYTNVYTKYLEERRNDPLTLVEIGVYHGSSMLMWLEYFPNARIVGVDINPMVDVPHCEIIKADQMTWTPNFPVDIFIDDGGHTWEQQKTTFRNVFPKLNSGGIYFVEDLHTSYMGSYADGPLNAVDYFKGQVDHMNRAGDSGLAQYGATEMSFIHFWRFLCAIGKS